MTFWIPHSPDIPTSSWETPPAGIIATAHVPFKQSFFLQFIATDENDAKDTFLNQEYMWLPQ